MAKDEKRTGETKSTQAKSPSTAFRASSASGASSAKSAPGGLSFQQKASLIGGAIILAAVLYLLLAPSGSGGADQTVFSHYLYNTSKNGIIVDVRGAPSSDVRQQIMQCGVNYISSPFYTNSTDRELVAYFCDDSGCLSSDYRFDLPNATPGFSNKSVPFSDAIYAMRSTPYIYVHAGNSAGDFVFHPTYLEVLINSKSNASDCSINSVGD